MKLYLIITCTLLLVSCQSSKQFNQQLTEAISVEKLQKDVDFSYKKLKKLHPKLYWYIRQDKLEYKLDSLKKSIQKPMTGLAFYKEISQVLKPIGQGHLAVFPALKKTTKKQQEFLNKKGKTPFNQLDLEFIDNKLIILKNRTKHLIKENTEITLINDEKPSDLITLFKKRIASDGYNTTMFNRYLGKNFGGKYTSEKGAIQDSLQLVLKLADKDTLLVVKRDTFGGNSKKNKLSKKQKKAEEKFNFKYGYNKDSKTFSREFKFIANDSSTALITIKGFSNGNYSDFYAESFAKLAVANTKNLIIDLRNNPGGRLTEIGDLYSYLVDKPFVFIDPYEVVSRTSKLHGDYFKGGGIVIKTIKIIIAPFYYSYNFLNVKKVDNKFLFKNEFSKLRKPNANNFKGKLYVLINGGSFSASSIISSNLKSNKRAFFVGEETGGAYNGTVAAQMPLVQLPNSKVNLRIGLAVVSATGKSEIEGRGIFPDKEIIPTFEDRKNNIDPELNWILDDIKRGNEVEELLKEKSVK